MSLIDGNFSDLKSSADVFPVKVPCERSLCVHAFSASVKLTKSPDKQSPDTSSQKVRSGSNKRCAQLKNILDFIKTPSFHQIPAFQGTGTNQLCSNMSENKENNVGPAYIVSSVFIARSAYYFRTGPFEKMCPFVCLSVRRFRDFTEGEMGFGQRLLSHGTLTGKTSALLFRSEKYSQLRTF